MLWKKREMLATPLGFLSRLARDVRGNTLAIMAIALIPLAGLMGGGIDISRMYITKTRLQHACDAGALAGRKAMGGGTWAQSNGMPNTVATQFFDANFPPNAYGARNLNRAFSENAGKVSGTASVELQMTLVKVVTKDWAYATLAVTCDAEMRLPNTDVMFVLDNTGSMDSKAVSSDPDTKMESLKTAVKCFYEIVARLNTDATCTTGNPGTSGTGNQVQIRFGFVPYSTNVNVGKLLPTSYFADSWPYQSREPVYRNVTTYTYPNQGTPTVTNTSYNWTNYGSWVDKQFTKSGTSSNNCQNNVPADTTPTTTGGEGNAYGSSTSTNNGVQTVTWKTDTPVSKYQYQYDSYVSNSKTCRYDRRQVTGTMTQTYTRTDTGVAQTTQVFDGWHYGQITQDISGLKNASTGTWATSSSITLPLGSNGANKTITWDGCIEERKTVQASSYDPRPSGAYDLDIDLVPSQGTATSLWAPALPGLIYLRNVTTSSNWWGTTVNWDQGNTADVAKTTAEYYNNVPYYCPAEAKKLQQWPDADDFDAYVDSLVPTGNTYHDIGMLWGARLMSPTGIFGSENALTPGGAEIERHMIFMTDGDAVSAPCDYTAYGVAFWDKRTTTDVGTASNCPNERSVLDDQVNARFTALCTAVKNMNITLWVISFGSGSNATTENRLQACATSGRYFTARNSATLQTTFANIANQISQLRLTK